MENTLSPVAREELIDALSDRYRFAAKAEKTRILDELAPAWLPPFPPTAQGTRCPLTGSIRKQMLSRSRSSRSWLSLSTEPVGGRTADAARDVARSDSGDIADTSATARHSGKHNPNRTARFTQRKLVCDGRTAADRTGGSIVVVSFLIGTPASRVETFARAPGGHG